MGSGEAGDFRSEFDELPAFVWMEPEEHIAAIGQVGVVQTSRQFLAPRGWFDQDSAAIGGAAGAADEPGVFEAIERRGDSGDGSAEGVGDGANGPGNGLRQDLE